MVLQGRQITGDVKYVLQLWAIGLLLVGIIIVVAFVVIALSGGQ